MLLVRNMQKGEEDDRFQSTAASRDADGVVRLMVSYLRPKNTGIILMVAGALLLGGKISS